MSEIKKCLNVVEKWRQVICIMLHIGGMEEAAQGLDEMEESMHTNVRIADMQSSILKVELGTVLEEGWIDFQQATHHQAERKHDGSYDEVFC